MSSLFASLVLNKVLRPLDRLLKQRAADRLGLGLLGDDTYGSITHLMAYIDDLSCLVPLEDLAYFFEQFKRLAEPLGCRMNVAKTRIQTSCSGESVIPTIRLTNPNLADEVEATIASYSVKPGPTPNTTVPVELTSGFRLLGTPVGSNAFALEFFKSKIQEVEDQLTLLHTSVPDLQTRLRIFAQCII